MRKKIALYFIFVFAFAIGKLGFMAYHGDVFGQYSIGQWMEAVWNGLPHDLTSAGYLMALPLLLELVQIWLPGKWHQSTMRFWIRLCWLMVLTNYLFDLVLYGYWGFRIDKTALFYLLDNPAEALGQAEWWMMAGGITALVILWWPLQKITLRIADVSSSADKSNVPAGNKQSIGKRVGRTAAAVLLCGLCFLAIRGGVTTSTMNVGRVYFSSEMPLNHAATNPFFSFFHSLARKQKDFSKQYRFMTADEAATAYAEMNASGIQIMADNFLTDEMEEAPLLKTLRPDIVLLIFESFSGAACTGVNKEADPTIMPNVNRMYEEGVGFSNMFANSFRTDRGCAAILASYPGQPTNSVMKDQDRCNNLQYLSKRLKENGYTTRFIHGGDVNFTNMKGFLTAGGFESITGDTDFAMSDRLSKWGVPDGKMFDYLYKEIIGENNHPSATGDERRKPFMKVMLTLSSHEPFDVDYHHFDDPYVNSLAYTDSCFGAFIDHMKKTLEWDNLLIIGVADHAFANYPAGIQNHEQMRYRIPMFWAGGAVANPQIISTYGSQTDIAATVLGQMGIGHEDFNFSKNMTDMSIGHYGFYAFSDGFGLITDSCSYIQDNAKNGSALSGSNDPNGTAERWGKAYLQTLYDDLAGRK